MSDEELIEVTLSRLTTAGDHFTLSCQLQEKYPKNRESRDCTISLGPETASAIYATTRHDIFQLKTVYDLVLTCLDTCGMTVTKGIINDFTDGVLKGLVQISHGSKTILFEGYAGDVIALALRANAPLFVAEKVFKRVAEIRQNKKTDEMTNLLLHAPLDKLPQA